MKREKEYNIDRMMLLVLWEMQLVKLIKVTFDASSLLLVLVDGVNGIPSNHYVAGAPVPKYIDMIHFFKDQSIFFGFVFSNRSS